MTDHFPRPDASASPQTEPRDTTRRWLTALSLVAGICYTASAEFELAEALGARPVIAAMLPLAIDVYVIAGVRWGRWYDIALSLSLMGAAQIAAHALDAGVLEVDLALVAVVSLLVPISIWRVHVLARGHRPAVAAQREATVTETVTVPAATEVPAGPQSDPEDAPPITPPDGEVIQDAPRLISSADVAQRYGVDNSTVRNWVAAKKLVVAEKDARGRNWFAEDALPAEVSR